MNLSEIKIKNVYKSCVNDYCELHGLLKGGAACRMDTVSVFFNTEFIKLFVVIAISSKVKQISLNDSLS